MNEDNEECNTTKQTRLRKMLLKNEPVLPNTSGKVNLYDILGLDMEVVRKLNIDDQKKAINEAFSDKIRISNSDKNGDDEIAMLIIAAKEILLNDERRARYHNEADYDKGWLSHQQCRAIFWPDCYTEKQNTAYWHRIGLTAKSSGLAIGGAIVTALTAGAAAPAVAVCGVLFGGGLIGAGIQSGMYTTTKDSVLNECDTKSYEVEAGIGFVRGASGGVAALAKTLKQPEEATALTKTLNQPEEATALTKTLIQPEEATALTKTLKQPEEATFICKSKRAGNSKMIITYLLNGKQIKGEVNGSGETVKIPLDAKKVEVKFQVRRWFWRNIMKYDRFTKTWCKPYEPHVFRYEKPPLERTFTISGFLGWEAVMRVSNEHHEETGEMVGDILKTDMKTADSETVDVTRTQENYPGQNPASSQAKGPNLDKHLKRDEAIEMLEKTSGHKKKRKCNLKEERAFFQDTFLNSECGLKDEVHKKLQRFPWLTGGYGINGPSKKNPRPHIYVTVKKGKKKSEVLKAIKDKFKCNPKKYFQILREPEEKPTFRYSSNPTSGGSVVAVHRPNGLNPVRVKDDNVDEESWSNRAAQTITMFCFRNGIHYALTCFHFCWDPDASGRHQPEKTFEIRNSIEFYKDYTKREVRFYYHDEGEEKNDICFGTFSDCYLDAKCDIISLKVSKKVEINCQLQEIDVPNWNEIWSELRDRKIFTNDAIAVQKHGFQDQEREEQSSNPAHRGHIFKLGHSYKCGDGILFQDACVIKGNSGSFLLAGDSGTLVWFVDKNNRKQAFAYGVAEVDELPEVEASSDEDNEALSESSSSSDCEENSEIISKSYSECVKNDGDVDDSQKDDVAGESSACDQNEGYAILLKLNIALNNLELSNAGCFQVCGGGQ